MKKYLKIYKEKSQEIFYIPVLRQERRAMRSFHDHDLARRYLPGRHGVSTHVAPVILDLH